jgi:SAM-dependent methyltransferase
MTNAPAQVSYWEDVSHHIGPAIEDAFWLTHPLVRARVNERIAGDPDTQPTEWLARYLADRLPLEDCVSVGCGTGHFERDLVRKGIVTRVVGVDTAGAPLAHAREENDKAGIASSQIQYLQADAREFLSARSGLSAIFFSNSLHHFDRLDDLLRRASAALRPDGLLYLDEYVGPSMREWNWRTLFLANLFHNLLPWQVRRVGLVRAPRNLEDPTEMICSSEILAAVARHFSIETARPYGGNLVSLIYANLRRPSPGHARPTPRQLDRAVHFLLGWEDALLRHGHFVGIQSYHSIVIAAPLRATQRRAR